MGILKVVDRYAKDDPELIRELEEKALPILDRDESQVQIATPASMKILFSCVSRF